MDSVVHLVEIEIAVHYILAAPKAMRGVRYSVSTMNMSKILTWMSAHKRKSKLHTASFVLFGEMWLHGCAGASHAVFLANTARERASGESARCFYRAEARALMHRNGGNGGDNSVSAPLLRSTASRDAAEVGFVFPNATNHCARALELGGSVRDAASTEHAIHSTRQKIPENAVTPLLLGTPRQAGHGEDEGWKERKLVMGRLNSLCGVWMSSATSNDWRSFV